MTDERLEAAAMAIAHGGHPLAVDWWGLLPEMERHRYRGIAGQALDAADAVDPLRAGPVGVQP